MLTGNTQGVAREPVDGTAPLADVAPKGVAAALVTAGVTAPSPARRSSRAAMALQRFAQLASLAHQIALREARALLRERVDLPFHRRTAPLPPWVGEAWLDAQGRPVVVARSPFTAASTPTVGSRPPSHRALSRLAQSLCDTAARGRVVLTVQERHSQRLAGVTAAGLEYVRTHPAELVVEQFELPPLRTLEIEAVNRGASLRVAAHYPICASDILDAPLVLGRGVSAEDLSARARKASLAAIEEAELAQGFARVVGQRHPPRQRQH